MLICMHDKNAFSGIEATEKGQGETRQCVSAMRLTSHS